MRAILYWIVVWVLEHDQAALVAQSPLDGVGWGLLECRHGAWLRGLCVFV